MKKPISAVKKKLVKPVRSNPLLKNFVTGRTPTLLGVKKLMFKIEKITVEGKTFDEVRTAYAQKPEQLVANGKIPVFFRKGEPIFGCYQQSSVLYSSLKELGISARLTRQILGGVPHSTVLFRLNGKLYEADPFYGQQINLVDKERKKNISYLMKRNQFKFIKPGKYTYQDYRKEKKTGKLI